jgi:hypothetical protein
VWNGSPLHGRRVLVRCYHGLGDTLQFIRYAPLVSAVAREVTVWAQPELLPLLRTVSGVGRLLPLDDGTPDVDYDVDVEVMELPHVFRSTLSTIPVNVPYVTAPRASLIDRGTRVGLVWRAGRWDPCRSIPFELIAALLDVPGLRCYQLQHGAGPEARHQNLCPLDNATIVQTAQYMRGVDLVITIDSLPAHLAGALGVPVWTLLHHRADWRWLERRNDSPWYPTMRLFRQPAPGEWRTVVDEVRRALVEWASSRASSESGGAR